MQTRGPGTPIARTLPWLLAAIILFSFVSKVIRLNQPPELYFDEVYHGFTATRYLHWDVDAYDPWAKSPPGMAFEWTHPPLAKLLMAGFMNVFGENAFGWRIGSVVAGTLSVWLVAQVALSLFGSPWIAALAAFLLSIEGLSFVESRIAMNDAYFICFMLFTVWQYLGWRKDPSSLKRLFITGLGVGCMAATKWTTLYVLIILGGDLLYRWFFRGELKKETRLHLVPVFLVLMPVVMYIGSYAQLFMLGKDWNFFVELQKQMWWYHSGLKATHLYQSKPYQWILNIRPIYMHVSKESNNEVSAGIYNLGNSVILLTGLFAVIRSIFTERKWTYPLGFTTAIYFMLWFPWNFSPRIMFFYHYAPAIPFLCILLARYLSTRERAQLVVVSLAVFWFFLFYPHNTALPVPRAFANAVYFAIPGWQ